MDKSFDSGNDSTTSAPCPLLRTNSSINSASTADGNKSSPQISIPSSQEFTGTSDSSAVFTAKSEAQAKEMNRELEEVNERIIKLEQELQKLRIRAADLQSVSICSNPSGNPKGLQDVEGAIIEGHTIVQVVEVSTPSPNRDGNPKKRRLQQPGISDNGVLSPEATLVVFEGEDVKAHIAPAPVYKNDGKIKSMDPDMHYIWFDLETTDAGIDASKIQILEVAILVTDWNFNPLDDGLQFLVHEPQFKSSKDLTRLMPSKVRGMHEKSGLLREWDSTPAENRLNLRQVEEHICKYLNDHRIYSKGIMSGIGVHFDRNLVQAHMRKLARIFSHQVFDTTALWHISKRRYGLERRFQEGTQCKHRAMDDIFDGIEEAKQYALHVFKAPQDVRLVL